MKNNMNELEQLQDLLDKHYPDLKYQPTQVLATIQQKLKEAGIQYELDQEPLTSDAIAYVYKLFGKHFNVYIDPNVSHDAHLCLLAHELGHVYFNHLSFLDIYKKQFGQIVLQNWDIISKYLEESLVKSKSKSHVAKFLYNKLSNIAQDMEINSKFFENDWKDVSMTIKRAQVESWITTGDISQAIMEFSALENGDESTLKYCHPSNLNWPEGLDWLSYMVYLVNNLEEFLKFDTQGSQGSQGDGEDSGLYTEQEVMGANSSQDATDQDKQEKQEQASQSGEKKLSEEDYEMKEDGCGSDPGSGVKKHQSEISKNCSSVKAFSDLLTRLAMTKQNTKMHSDTFYYANRGRTSGNGGVLTPKRQYVSKYDKSNIQIVLDVSGSVPTSAVEKIVKTILDNNTFQKKKSHLIQWDTHLCSDTTLDKAHRISSGGGTDIADGISYSKKYLKKKEDKLFIISDFEDNLNYWVDAAKGIKGDIVAIQWFYGNRPDSSYKKVKNFTKTFDVYTVKLD